MTETPTHPVATSASGPSAKADAQAAILSRRRELVALSHAIHASPETAWNEHRAAAMVAESVATAGLRSEVGVFGVATAVEASLGSGDLCVAICAEYDALPALGHACGHNVIAAAAVGAVIGLACVADAIGLRVRLLGTPAEELGGGKIALLRAGAWEDVDFSLMVHGSTGFDVPARAYTSSAVERLAVTFVGRSAHAAAASATSINAGAAATLSLVAIGLLRQQLPAGVSVNAIVSDGGESTNIIPGVATLQVEIRGDRVEAWNDARTRVLACFEGAAHAIGCEWSCAVTAPPYAPLRQDSLLASFWDVNVAARGRALTAEPSVFNGASTDMGNVSRVVPSLHPAIAFIGEQAAPHSREFAVAAAGPAADDAIVDSAIAMAWTAIDVATTPAARREMTSRRKARAAGATRIPFVAEEGGAS